MRLSPSVVMCRFADLGVAVRDAAPSDSALIRTARMTGDLDPDDLVEEARSALALLDKGAAQPDFRRHLTPPLHRQSRARTRRMIARAERFRNDWDQ